MLNSQKDWKLSVTYKGITSESISPEKKSLLSIFKCGAESVKFFGNESMSPFNFDNYTMTIAKMANTDSLVAGLNIM